MTRIVLVLVVLLGIASSAGAQDSEMLSTLLKQPILPPETALREIRGFIEKRIPPFKTPESARQWTRDSESMRRRLLADIVYRGVPKEWYTTKTRVVWTGVIPTNGGYRIRKLQYEAVPGLWIPALLYEPENLKGRVPAVLNVNGHVGQPGKSVPYEQIRCINLAKRGILALHPEWLSCGELSDGEYRHNRLAYLDLCGVSGLSVFYLAMRRGLDILESHPHADKKRMAMTGLSGGGWQTIWLSALDKRIAATAPNAGYIGLKYRVYNQGDIGDLEQNPCDMLRIADYTHMTAMLAPRAALLIYNEKDDCCFRSERAKVSVYDPILPVFGLYGRDKHFEFYNNTVPGTHNYDEDNREQFYALVNREFGITPVNNSEIPADSEVLSYDALHVGIPNNNAGFGKLAEGIIASMPEREKRGAADDGRRLAQILRLPSYEHTVSTITGRTEMGPAGATITRRLLLLGDSWTLPVVEVLPENPKGLAIVVDQRGRADSAKAVAKILQRGMRALVVDLALCGECDPPGTPRAQHAMMIGAVGERLLGIQAAQLIALRKWAAREFNTQNVVLAGSGRTGSVIALMAAALADSKVDELVLDDLPGSFKELIAERVEYDSCPELFCFGLLREFDIPDIVKMARP